MANITRIKYHTYQDKREKGPIHISPFGSLKSGLDDSTQERKREKKMIVFQTSATFTQRESCINLNSIYFLKSRSVFSIFRTSV